MTDNKPLTKKRFESILKKVFTQLGRKLKRRLIKISRKSKPRVDIFVGKRFLWNRFLSHDWSGKNFRKI